MEIKKAFPVIMERIERACANSGRNVKDVTLVAISKGQPAEAINEAVSCGIKNIGENYVQEFLDKKERVTDKDIYWHFTGQLQSNKVKYLKGNVNYIHSVYTDSVITEIEKRISPEDIKIFLEINAGNEESKGGINTKEINTFMENLMRKHKIRPIGLMCIPPFNEQPEQSRPYFSALRELMHKLNKEYGLDMKHLSMGMSADFDIAVEEGATYVRVGTLLFGERKKTI